MGFDPWVGTKYWSEAIAGVRVLALGESHYGDPSRDKTTFTTEIVQEIVYGSSRKAYFTKIAKLFSGIGAGEYIASESIQDIWGRIAFYNYIPHMLPHSRVRPSKEMWRDAQLLLPNVLSKLKPQVVVVLGKQLAD